MLDLSRIGPPDLDNQLLAPFWEGTSRNQLRVQKCSGCGQLIWLPRYICPVCYRPNLVWAPVGTRASLFTWTEVGRSTSPGFENGSYLIGIVQLQDHPHIRMVGNLINIASDELVPGLPMQARFVRLQAPGEPSLVHWAQARDVDAKCDHTPS